MIIRLWRKALLVAMVFLTVAASAEEKIQHVEDFALDPAAFTFSDETQQIHTLEEYKGTWVVVNFWAVWCTPCVAELPSLAAFADAFAGKMEVLTLAQGRETHSELAAFLSEVDAANLPNYKDDKSAAYRAVKARGLPTSIVINPAGQMVARIEGEIDWMSDSVRKKFENWLSKP